ncbi:MAG: ABC transporter permease [Planctomycetia bacterium]|nr:ABC transporter permease [Planctomycetia bacterium]
MFTYLCRRILISFVTLFIITIIVFVLVRKMPGTPITQLTLADPSREISQENMEMLNKIYGLDKGPITAYFIWIGNIFQGDMGTSFKEHENVAIVISRRIGPTLLLSITSLIITYSLAVPMGLFSVVNRGRPSERILSTTLYMLYSLPSFVVAIGLLILFYQRLGWLPPGMFSDDYSQLEPTYKILDIAKHMILPVLCYTYGTLASLSRFVKSNMEEVIRQDYIRTAKAKGVAPLNIIVNHAFRNTLIPFVTMIGLTLPGLLGGSIILEQIFEWPGMGQLFFKSITDRDYPVIMGMILMYSVLTLLGQLLADILYVFVDPRVTYK